VRKPLLLAACAASAVLAFANSSRANGRFPAANQLVFSPADPNYIVLRATYAILPSTDNGITWRYLCEAALGLPSDQGEDPSIGIMGNGALIAGIPGARTGGIGLNVSTNRGCDWTCEVNNGLLNQTITDVAVRPDNPASAVALTGTIQPNDGSSTTTYLTQVFETTDNGQTWTALPTPIDPTVIVQTIDVTKSDPDRIYVSATRGYGSFAKAMLIVSKDHGMTWTELPIPQFNSDTESGIYIGAIDPTNADRVYLRTAALVEGGQSRVFYTNNAGAAPDAAAFLQSASLPSEGGFEVDEAGMYDITGELLGMALSPDGSELYVGTVESGLWEAKTSDMVFTQKNANVHVKCLARRGTELWACSEVDNPGDFVLGVSEDDGATFATRIEYVTSLCSAVDCPANPGGPLGCGASTNASTCGAAFSDFCSLTDVTTSCGTCPSSSDGGASQDASVTDAGVHTGGGGSSPSSSSCGCSVVGQGGAKGLAAGLAFAGLALTRRRKTRPRTRR
jgi:MYXO-CTERM domain-containing protein